MGAVVLTAATSGGAVIPVIMSPVNDSRGIRYGFCVVVAVFAFGLLLPLYATVITSARHQVDPGHKRSENHGSDLGHSARVKNLSRALTTMVRKRHRPSEPSPEASDEKRRGEA